MALPYRTFSSIDLGFLQLHVWGIFAALAFLVAFWFAAREAKRRRLDSEVIWDLAPWLIFGSILGARIVFFLENPLALTSPLEFFRVWNGGLAFHGGFAGGVAAFLIFARLRRLDFWKYADAVAPAIALGHAVGRCGCFLTGLHIGKEADVPWAVYYDGALRHATPLYEFMALMAIFGFLLWFRNQKLAFDGFLFAAYLALYSVARFVIEFYRADPTYFGFTVAQYITVVLFAASSSFIVLRLRQAHA